MAQAISSLGDWIGVIAIAFLADRVGGYLGVGVVMTARVLPGFLVGPAGGVIADRWNRKQTMMVADLARAALLATLPFVHNLGYLLVVSVLLESLTLLWGPAKDASLPHLIKPAHLTHANSLTLIAVYGPWPLASVVYAALATLASFLAARVDVLAALQGFELALYVDALTFCFSAAMIGTLSIPHDKSGATKLDLSQAWRDLVEGLRFVKDHRQVRPWLIGIAFTFTAAGGVFSLGVAFVRQVLNGGQRGYAILIGVLGTGLLMGLLAAGLLVRRLQKDVVFSSSIVLSAIGLIVLAGVGSLDQAVPVAGALGFFGGVGYSTGYALMHEATADEIKGRTFGAVYTVIRIGILVGLGVFPFIARLIGDHTLDLPTGTLELPGSRMTLWLAGLFALGGGTLSMRAISARRSGTLRDESARGKRGYFIVFEGGEGAGKSTQMAAFVAWLEARGEDVVVTREPGGTTVGARIRELLLDPEQEAMDARTEALLYAADRSEHVARVVRPALEQGKTVVSDRGIDSSLAYQGAGRGLGVDDVYRISEWATEGLLPDLVYVLRVDPDTGLRRVPDDPDRLEREDRGFHERVAAAYLELAGRWPDRFVVVDAARPKSEVHAEIVEAFEQRGRGGRLPDPLGASVTPQGSGLPR